MTAVSPENRTFDPASLARLLDGRYAEVRQEIRAVMRRPEFAPVVGLPAVEYRLVDAFGIPDEVLAAPIGLADAAAAQR